jgi:uncharacterized protein
MPGVNQLNGDYLRTSYSKVHINLVVRDPHTLFAFWEISDERRKAFAHEFGEELWYSSVPVLKVANTSRNTFQYFELNDSINSLYINVVNADNTYTAEIGRKVSEQFFIGIEASNNIVTPEDKLNINTTAIFADYNDLRAGILDIKSLSIERNFYFSDDKQILTGLSSLEFYKTNINETGVSI